MRNRPGYRKRAPREKPVLGPFVALIHEILEADKKAPPKQRHTAKRILERLREYRGQPRKVAMFVMSLPFSDALFCQVFPRECTKTFQEGHRRAFEFFGGVPKRISYDNSRIAVTKVIQKRGGEFTREFLRLESHYLFSHHFCLVRRPNEKGHTENLVGYSRRNFWKRTAGRCCRCRRDPSRPGVWNWAKPIPCRWSALTGTTIRFPRGTPSLTVYIRF